MINTCRINPFSCSMVMKELIGVLMCNCCSNLSFYSPDKTYRARQNVMAHEEEPALLTGSSADFSVQED